MAVEQTALYLQVILNPPPPQLAPELCKGINENVLRRTFKPLSPVAGAV